MAGPVGGIGNVYNRDDSRMEIENPLKRGREGGSEEEPAEKRLRVAQEKFKEFRVDHEQRFDALRRDYNDLQNHLAEARQRSEDALRRADWAYNVGRGALLFTGVFVVGTLYMAATGGTGAVVPALGGGDVIVKAGVIVKTALLSKASTVGTATALSPVLSGSQMAALALPTIAVARVKTMKIGEEECK